MSSLGGLDSVKEYLQGDREWVETLERGRTIKKRRSSVPASTLPPLTLFPPTSLESTLPGLDLPFPFLPHTNGGRVSPFVIPSDPALFRLSTNPTNPNLDTTPFAPLPGFPPGIDPRTSFTLPPMQPPQSTLDSLAALCGDLYENGSLPSPMDSTFSDPAHPSISPQATNKVTSKDVTRSRSRQRRSSVSSNASNGPVRPVAVAVPARDILRPHRCIHIGCSKSFARPSALAIHARSHNGDRPYACPCCYRAFAAACNLTRHMKQVHPEIDVTDVPATDIPDIDVVALTPSPSPPLFDPALSAAPNVKKRKKSKKKKKVKYRIIGRKDVAARDEGDYTLDPRLPVVKVVEGERIEDVLEKWTETGSAIHSNEEMDECTPLPQFDPRLYAHTALPLSPLSPVTPSASLIPPRFELPLPPPPSSGFYHSPPPPQTYPLPFYDPSYLPTPPTYYPTQSAFPSQPPPPPIYNFQMPLPPRYPAPFPFPPTPPPTASFNPQSSFDLSQVLLLPPFEPLYGVSQSQTSPILHEREDRMDIIGMGGIEEEGEIERMEIP
ncbi:hypothetical protein JCM5353_006442 [Sporobolomyces roseus]